MLASLVSSASPNSPLMPPVTARLIWQATPCTFGSSKPSTTILSLGPIQRNFVLTSPVVPRPGRIHSQAAKTRTTSRAKIPAIEPSLRMLRAAPTSGSPSEQRRCARSDPRDPSVAVGDFAALDGNQLLAKLL